MTITVQPPKPAEAKAAYGYDQAYGTAKTKVDGTVIFSLGKFLIGRMAIFVSPYNASLFPDTPVTSYEPMLDKIQSDREAIDKSAAARAKLENRWQKFALFIVGSLAVIALGRIIQAITKRKETGREVEQQLGGISRFPIESISLPAMLLFTNYGHLPTSAMTAALLDLVRKGNVKQISEKEYKLVDRNPSYVHEQRLIKWLFDDLPPIK